MTKLSVLCKKINNAAVNKKIKVFIILAGSLSDIWQTITFRYLRIQSWTHRTVVNVRWFSDDEKFEKKSKGKREESKEKSEKNVKNQESVKKLNALLGSMPLASKSKIKIQKPKKKEKPAEPPKPQETRTEKIM